MISIYAATYNMLQVRTYILVADDGQCAIVDPGCQNVAESEHLEAYIGRNNLRPVAIWLTHLHLDHVMGVARAAHHWDIPVFAGKNDEYLLPLINPLAREWQIPEPEPFVVSRWLTNGEMLSLGESQIEAIEVPGHTAGSIVYYCPDAQACICGDVLFRMSVGRSDLPGGNAQQLIDGIRTKLLTLPPDTEVFPGHGPKTSIADEQAMNPYLISI